MSDENKKEQLKKQFFRINTQGELSQTVRENDPNTPDSEPNTLHSIEDQEMGDLQTEVKAKEPSLFSSSTEETLSKIIQEPNLIEASERQSTPKNLEDISEEPYKNEPKQSEPSDASLYSEWQAEQTSWEGTGALHQKQTTSAISPLAPLPEEVDKLVAPTSDNSETLRNYISLKEKEVSDLKDQQKQYQNVLIKLKRTHSELNQVNLDLQRELEAAKTTEEFIKKEMVQLRERHENELAILKNDFENQQQKNGVFQEQLQDLNRQKNIWKEKINEDLKRIKLKEKELENRYELLKKDTETLLDSKDQQVLELKKKTDALELELQSLEDRLRKEQAVVNSIDSKKRKLIETLKLAISLLEQLTLEEEIQEERKIG